MDYYESTDNWIRIEENSYDTEVKVTRHLIKIQSF